VSNLLIEYKIINRIIAFIADNALYNRKFFKDFKKLIIESLISEALKEELETTVTNLNTRRASIQNIVLLLYLSYILQLIIRDLLTFIKVRLINDELRRN